MAGQLQMFVVETRSRGSMSWVSFTLNPKLGVMATASAYTESTAKTGYAAQCADEMTGYFELGFADRIDKVPALLKYDRSSRAFSAARLRASIQLANERLFRQADVGEIVTSAAAVHATGGRASVVGAGPDAEVWRVRAGRLEWLLRPARNEDPEQLGWIGRRADIDATMSEVALEPGDVIGMGRADAGLIKIFQEDGARFDTALARCLAESPVPGLRYLLGRWVG